VRAILVLFLAFAAFPAAATELTVTVENVRYTNGTIRLGVFDSPATWLDGDRAMKRAAVPATQPTTTIRIEDVKPGIYAVATFHDENNNGKHDRNLLGVPTERFGFSRNPTVVLSAPSFDECKVEIPAAGATISVRLKY
jgi:uncharacterized protein (DUF2141 family)